MMGKLKIRRSKKHLGKNSQKLKELRLQMRKHLITSLSLK